MDCSNLALSHTTLSQDETSGHSIHSYIKRRCSQVLKNIRQVTDNRIPQHDPQDSTSTFRSCLCCAMLSDLSAGSVALGEGRFAYTHSPVLTCCLGAWPWDSGVSAAWHNARGKQTVHHRAATSRSDVRCQETQCKPVLGAGHLLGQKQLSGIQPLSEASSK